MTAPSPAARVGAEATRAAVPLAYPPVSAVAQSEVVSIQIPLTYTQANDLYNEVCSLLREHGIHTVHNRYLLDVPAIYATYDALAALGIDGTGR